MTDITAIAPLGKAGLLSCLDALGIAHDTVDHPPLRTVADSQALRGEIAGAHTKNLFLKDRKDHLFLVVLLEDASVDLKRIHEKIGANGKVSFGKPELLMEVFGVVPGAVTAFGAVNDRQGRVKVVLDANLMREELINCHPLVNTSTTTISSRDLIRFLEHTGHPPAIIAVSESTAVADP